ncbi:MAG: hypothetical protein IKN09_02300 [Clostridia bacterium]|nr:hypothetical protein [Clostridia bacterium]
MKVEFDISKCSTRFLNELAKITESKETLKEIVDYAITDDHYDEKSLDEFYLEAVIMNPKVSIESIQAIIKCKNARYARWSIVDREVLSQDIMEQVAKLEKDFSLIGYMLEKHPITEEIANIIASRLVGNEIDLNDCIRYDSPEERALYEKDAIELILKKCSSEWKEKLRKWYSEKN